MKDSMLATKIAFQKKLDRRVMFDTRYSNNTQLDHTLSSKIAQRVAEHRRRCRNLTSSKGRLFVSRTRRETMQTNANDAELVIVQDLLAKAALITIHLV